jgi:hypothetical protein
LYISMAKQCTKYQMNIWKHEQKSAENWFTGLTDRRTDKV